MLVQNSYITATSHPFCLFNSIPIHSVTVYHSALFHGTFILLHCRILEPQCSSHHLFLFYGKEQNDISAVYIILHLTIWHDIKLTAQEFLCVYLVWYQRTLASANSVMLKSTLSLSICQGHVCLLSHVNICSLIDCRSPQRTKHTL